MLEMLHFQGVVSTCFQREKEEKEEEEEVR